MTIYPARPNYAQLYDDRVAGRTHEHRSIK